MSACPFCESTETATLPMIHQSGVSVTTKRGILGQHKGTSVTMTALAATAVPPTKRRAAVTTAGVIVTGVGGVACLGGAPLFGGVICIAGIAAIVSGRKTETEHFTKQMREWESTWCCRSCGKRWSST